MLWSVSLAQFMYVSHSIAYVHFFFFSLFLLLLKSFSYKAIYNWKFVHRHPRHLDFCRQYRHIWLEYNSRIRYFWYLFSYIFCFLFGYCFIWMECSQLKSINFCYAAVIEKKTCTKLMPWVHYMPDFQTWISGRLPHAKGKIK